MTRFESSLIILLAAAITLAAIMARYKTDQVGNSFSTVVTDRWTGSLWQCSQTQCWRRTLLAKPPQD